MKKKLPAVQRWKSDPHAPPDWRARDAARLVAGERTEWADASDRGVRAYADYLRSIAAASPSQPAGEIGQSPLSTAHQLHKENGPRRWELEARLIAGQSNKEIAEKCVLLPEAVAAYAEVFCDIRGCLGAGDYLLHHLVGPGVHAGFKEHEVGRFWAWTAMSGGSLALNAFIKAFHAARRPDHPAVLGVYVEPDAGVPVNLQAVVATAVLPRAELAEEAFHESHLLLTEAKAASDPDRAAFLREKARDWVIRCARAYLAGKPLPRPRRPRVAVDGGNNAAREMPPRKKPMTFAAWDNLVAAAFSGNRGTARSKS